MGRKPVMPQNKEARNDGRQEQEANTAEDAPDKRTRSLNEMFSTNLNHLSSSCRVDYSEYVVL
jgi:hypothetical protein